jgi:carbon storage regulator CsrA
LGESEAAESAEHKSSAPWRGEGRLSRMLILVRKIQQGIAIEGGISIQVLSIDRDRVKLGIIAPENVKVMRQELLDDVDPPIALAGGIAPPNGNGHHA